MAAGNTAINKQLCPSAAAACFLTLRWSNTVWPHHPHMGTFSAGSTVPIVCLNHSASRSACEGTAWLTLIVSHEVGVRMSKSMFCVGM